MDKNASQSQPEPPVHKFRHHHSEEEQFVNTQLCQNPGSVMFPHNQINKLTNFSLDLDQESLQVQPQSNTPGSPAVQPSTSGVSQPRQQLKMTERSRTKCRMSKQTSEDKQEY